MNAAQYAQQFMKLLPPGVAWSRDPNSLMARFISAFSEEPARLNARWLQLQEEADPRTTVELLPDWERLTGLPDACAGDDQSLAGRRARLAAQLIQIGGQSRAYFISVAAALGYAVTISEFLPVTCDSDCDSACSGDAYLFAWQVNAPATTVEDMDCDSFCDESIRSWGNDVLECTIRRISPEHSTVIFAYS